MSDSNSNNSNGGIIVESSNDVFGGATTDQDRATILANALGDKQVAEEPQVEEPVVEEPEIEAQEPKQDDEFAAKFAALSRKEKAVREQEAAIEARLAEIEARQKAMDEQYGKYQDLDTRIKNRPMDVLSENGVDFETLAKMVLENDGKPTPEMEIERLRQDMETKYMKELENLRNELSEKEQKAEEQKYNEVIENYKYELNEFIDTNSENYELIKLNDASDLVYEVIEEHYNETGRILSNNDACEHVENYLLDEAKKHLNVNKIKSLLGNQETAAPKPSAPQQTAVNTLSNTESASVPSSSSRFLSEDESKREAAKLIKWVE